MHRDPNDISTEYRNKLLFLSLFTRTLGLLTNAIIEENELRIYTGKNMEK